MTFDPPFATIIFTNLFLLVLALLVALAITRSSIRYNRHLGDDNVRDRQQFIIIQLVVFLIFIGLLASAMNLFFT